MSLNAIGNAYRHMGDTASALLFFEESILIYSQTAETQGRAQALLNQAAVLMDLAKLDEAQKKIQMAHQWVGDDRRLALIHLRTRGILLTRKGAYLQAEELLKTALAMVGKEDALEYTAVQFSLGRLYLEMGDPTLAYRHLSEALEVDRQENYYRRVADDLAALASAKIALNRQAEAVGDLKRSLKIYALLGDGDRVAQILDRLEPLAKETTMDLRVTKHFIQRWLDGDTEETLCR
jgi:tetratricopeptide (TPR) repeat protein